MGSRSIDGPGKGRHVSTETAADWLAVSEDTFEGIAASHPWLRPVRIGRKVLWHWLDIVALAQVMAGTEAVPTARNPDPAAPDRKRPKGTEGD